MKEITKIEPLTELYLLNDTYYVTDIYLDIHGDAQLSLEKFDKLSYFAKEEVRRNKRKDK